tara:strand:- start:12 stop:1709 length:1698 start_codon:yes stop_codon:yes gene_type:complete
MKNSIFILTLVLMLALFSFGATAASTYNVQTAAYDYNDLTNMLDDVTVTLGGITKTAQPIAEFNNVPSGIVYDLVYQAEDYKDTDFTMLFDPKLDTLSGQGDFLQHTNGNQVFNTMCDLTQLNDIDYYRCEVSNNGYDEIFYFNPETKNIVIRSKMVAEDVEQETEHPKINEFTANQVSGQASLEVTFTYDVSDDNEVKYTILNFQDGTSIDLDEEQGTVVHTYDTPGTYNAFLHVTDNNGLTAYKEIEITVLSSDETISFVNPNEDSAVFGDNYEISWLINHPTPGLFVNLFYAYSGAGEWTEIASDVAAETGSYLWDTLLLQDGNEYRLKMIVTKLGQAIDSTYSGIFTVDNYNQPPISDAGQDREVVVDKTSLLDGSNSYEKDKRPEFATIQSYQWELQSGPTVTIENADQEVATFKPQITGTYVFRLTVSDGQYEDTDSVTISVIESPDELDSNERDIFVNRIRTNGNQVYYKPGELMDVSVTLSNYNEEDIEQAVIHVIIPKLNLIKEFGPFELEEDDLINNEVRFQIPEDAEAGTYEMRTIISTGSDQRVKIRRIKVME